MEISPFKLFIADGEDPIEIPREILKYFGFFQAAHKDSEYEEFSEDAKFRLDRQLWAFIISVYVKHDDLYSNDEPLKKAIDDDNVDKTLAFFDIKMLYTLIRTFDYYDMPLFLMATIRQVMRRLLCMTTEQLYLTHRELKRTDESCTTIVGAIVGDCARQSLILTILTTYVGISYIVDMIHDRFMPRIENVLTAGHDFSLVLTKRGVFSCGTNKNGQLGRPMKADNLKFQRVTLENVVSVKAGYDTSFFLTQCGTLYSVGDNEEKQLGREMIGEDPSNKPGKVSLDFVLTMAASLYHAIALTADGVYTWGKNRHGQLGNGTRIRQSTPTRLTIDAPIIDIGIGVGYSAMLSEAGDFYVCGVDSYLVPTKIALPGPVKKMICLASRVILIMRNDTLYVWIDTSALFVNDPSKNPILSITTIMENAGIKTDRIFGVFDLVYAFGNNGGLYRLDFVFTGEVSLDTTLIMENSSDVIDVTGYNTHTLIIKKDGLYGIGSRLPLSLERDRDDYGYDFVGAPTKLPLVVGHEEFADTPSSGAKKRKIGNNRLSCYKCGSGDPASLHLHSKSEKLFCGSSCFNAYRNPPPF